MANIGDVICFRVIDRRVAKEFEYHLEPYNAVSTDPTNGIVPIVREVHKLDKVLYLAYFNLHFHDFELNVLHEKAKEYVDEFMKQINLSH